eukprot:1179963-Prorocentrum_minimum.AAC.3
MFLFTNFDRGGEHGEESGNSSHIIRTFGELLHLSLSWGLTRIWVSRSSPSWAPPPFRGRSGEAHQVGPLLHFEGGAEGGPQRRRRPLQYPRHPVVFLLVDQPIARRKSGVSAASGPIARRHPGV